MSGITQESLWVSGVLLAKVLDRQPREVTRYRTENARQTALQVDKSQPRHVASCVVAQTMPPPEIFHEP